MKLVSRIKQALSWRQKRLLDWLLLRRAERQRRRLSETVFVGITGSVGKTTAKDLAVAVLSRAAPTCGNAASLNYLVDLAHVVVSARRSDRYAVVEIGISTPGSIDAKIALARPQIAAWTVVGRDHIKAFGSMEAIAEEKGKLVRALPADGIAVLNIDDPLVRKVGETVRARRLWFGRSPEADIRLIEAVSVFPDPLTLTIEYQQRQLKVPTGLHGTHLTVPVLAALGIGLAAGMPVEECIAALKSVSTTPGRMQIVESTGGVTFVRDDYKAPHWSFQPALDFMRDANARRKVAVIGTLSDYSLSASKLYPKVARQAMDVADLVVFVGPHALRGLKARRSDSDRSIVAFTEIEDAHRFLQSELRDGDLVLLKGSNRADHLVRLFLARSREVRCWVSGCGLNRFCDACPRLEAPVSFVAGAAHGHGSVADDESLAAIAAPEGEPAPTQNAWLILGLGNAGDAYAGTPHNIGFEALDALASRVGAPWLPDSDGLVCPCVIDGQSVVLFKPAGTINVCGPLVERQRRSRGISADRVLVVHDDADLALSDVRVKRSGSDGGHKGLRSLFAALGNDGAMLRLRMGVRTARDSDEGARALVLQRFAPEDMPLLNAAIASAGDRVSEVIRAPVDSPAQKPARQALHP
jgi:aminoacyl-tRNA hydrolase